jgi:hypothetical protein
MDLTRDLKHLVASYLRPSEQVIYLGDGILNDWQYWINQARDLPGISPEIFNEKTTRFIPNPYKRYLRYYAEAGYVDYGCDRYVKPDGRDKLFLRALQEQDLKMLIYLWSSCTQWIHLEESLSYLAHQDDYKEYLPYLIFDEDGEISFEIRRAVIQRDREKILALFTGEQGGNNTAAFNEAIRLNDPEMIKFIISKMGRPRYSHLYYALDNGSDEVFELICRNIHAAGYIFKPFDWEQAHQYACLKKLWNKAALIRKVIDDIEQRPMLD